MHASFLLGFLPLLVQGAAVAPSATAVPSASNITAVSGMAKRDNCGIGGSGIQPADIYSMVGDLQYNDPDSLRYVAHGNWIAWTVGSATICLFNDYLTENTHVSRWESGWAASFIQNECGCTSNAW